MHVKEITSQQEWDAFVLPLAPNTFLQSWQWKQIQESDGEHVSMLGLYTEETLVAVALLIRVMAKRGAYYLCPHGPIIKNDSDLQESITALKEYAVSHAHSDHTVALRIAPLIIQNTQAHAVFRDLGFLPAPMHVHAELTWVLDITPQEEDIFRGMRKTTRHAIKKAEAADVRVEILSDASGLDRFWPLYEQTTNRHGFVAFEKSFIQSQAEVFGATSAMFFAIATHEGKDIAGAMLIQFGNTIFYYHGASVKTSVPAAQLLQWRAIQEAKKRGAARYNFWGIAPENQPNHPFAGITVFKKGFGGYAIDYMHAQDYVLSWKYWILWAIEMYRKKKRGF